MPADHISEIHVPLGQRFRRGKKSKIFISQAADTQTKVPFIPEEIFSVELSQQIQKMDPQLCWFQCIQRRPKSLKAKGQSAHVCSFHTVCWLQCPLWCRSSWNGNAGNRLCLRGYFECLSFFRMCQFLKSTKKHDRTTKCSNQ